MYTTIEPRLIALLNDEPSESIIASPSLELPPLHDPNILKASGRPLLLEPDASKRAGKPSPSSQLVSQHTALIASIDDDDSMHKSEQSSKKSRKELSITDRALGSTSPQSLRKILDDDAESSPSSSSKKRRIVESGKDEFVQLPQPPKKQKAAKQVVPPIIIGLFEPPPQAALFPPIASSSFHDSHGRNSLNTVLPKVKDQEAGLNLDVSLNTTEERRTATKETKRKDVRARKKWTEEETNNLLLGVHKYGVGRWTDILEDPEFSFNARTGVDLKDRFRTCCPVELRDKAIKPANTIQHLEKTAKSNSIQAKSKSSLMSENILIEEDELAGYNTSNINESFSFPSNRSRKSRAHRKKLEDLVHLGIDGPFRKSQRRERRPFSDEDDRHILEGYKLYGPAWTRIQKDPRFNLQSRQPTDLRDRFRNKYPDKFRHAGDEPSKDTQIMDGKGKENSAFTVTSLPSTLQTSSSRERLKVQQILSPEPVKTVTKIFPLQPQVSLYGFKENFLPVSDHPVPVESVDSLPFTQSFDWNEGIAAPFAGTMGEMDISRLLLDETWTENVPNFNGKHKPSYTDINSICTSSTDPVPQGHQIYNMLACDPEQIITMPSSGTLNHDSSFE